MTVSPLACASGDTVISSQGIADSNQGKSGLLWQAIVQALRVGSDCCALHICHPARAPASMRHFNLINSTVHGACCARDCGSLPNNLFGECPCAPRTNLSAIHSVVTAKISLRAFPFLISVWTEQSGICSESFALYVPSFSDANCWRLSDICLSKLCQLSEPRCAHGEGSITVSNLKAVSCGHWRLSTASTT